MIHGFLFAAVAALFRRACKVVGWFAAVTSAFHGLARFDVRARAPSSHPPTDFSAPLKIFELREQCVRKRLHSRRALKLFLSFALTVLLIPVTRQLGE
jgi:hypothetical protein